MGVVFPYVMVMTTLAAYLPTMKVCSTSKDQRKCALLRMVNVFAGLFVTVQDVGSRHSGLNWFVCLTNLSVQERMKSPAEVMSNIGP